MSEADLSLNMIRFGQNDALPERRVLQAGPVTAVLEGADLRYVRVNGVEVVRRLYMAVRDHNWSTPAPRFTSYGVEDGGDHFRVDFTAEHVAGDVDFSWTGSIVGSPDGTISASMDGAPRKEFRRNRIGWCLLHPADNRGLMAATETPDGRLTKPFPTLISPHQPFLNLLSLSHPAGEGVTVTFSFTGDLFETEDQRNWTDASFKTYSTPISLPYPVLVTPKDKIRQTVTLSITGTPAAEGSDAAPAPDVVVARGGGVPMPRIGFGAHSGGKQPGEAADALRQLNPGHLWIDLDLGKDGWETRLQNAATEAETLGASLEVAAVAQDGNAGFDQLAAAAKNLTVKVVRLFAFPAITLPMAFPRHDLETTPEVLSAAKGAFKAAGLQAKAGGGSRANFTELNRALAVPAAEMETATYTHNPQVHASDILTMVECISASAETAESASVLVEQTPLAIGPITLNMASNPNATGPASEPGPVELPFNVDARQMSLFGAGWTVGSLAKMALSGASSLTYYRTTGWRGLVERTTGLTRHEQFPSVPGQLFPLYHVFAAVADMGEGAEALPVTLGDGLRTEALAIRSGNQLRVLVANYANEERTVEVVLPGCSNRRVRHLDETTHDPALSDPGFFTGPGAEAIGDAGGPTHIAMLPFAVACIDATLG